MPHFLHLCNDTRNLSFARLFATLLGVSKVDKSAESQLAASWGDLKTKTSPFIACVLPLGVHVTDSGK